VWLGAGEFSSNYVGALHDTQSRRTATWTTSRRHDNYPTNRTSRGVRNIGARKRITFVSVRAITQRGLKGIVSSESKNCSGPSDIRPKFRDVVAGSPILRVRSALHRG
jgi:hypothetical protein